MFVCACVYLDVCACVYLDAEARGACCWMSSSIAIICHLTFWDRVSVEPQIWRFSWPASLRDCGVLKENGPHRLIGTGTIRCGLVGVSAVLLEKVCLHLFLLPTDPDVEFSGTLQHQLCLHAAMLLPWWQWTKSFNSKPVPSKCFPS